jgi:DNA-binding MarR family transcriptional regulator
MSRTLVTELLQEVRRLTEAAHDARAERLAHSGLGAFERRLLELLHGTPLSSQRLARSLLCPASEVEAAVAALRRRGWIEDIRSKDASPPTMQLSPAGRRALTSVRQVERGLDAALEAALNLDDLRAVIEVLRTARRRLDATHHARRRLVRPRGASGFEGRRRESERAVAAETGA